MLRIKGGKVYDPANGINGEIRDVCISDGRIVADVEGGRTIDATGMVVFPGGVDVHTHVAGAALNFARAMIPEDHRRNAPFVRTAVRRGGIGGSTPTTFVTGYLYAGMGWTTVNEAAVPILSARHTHEELRDTPIVDQIVLRADGQQRDPARPDRGRRARARQARRRLEHLGGQGLRRQGGQPRRRGGVEVGQGRQVPARADRRLQQGDAGQDHRRPGPDRGRSAACRTRCTCTATTSARRATTRPRWRP